MYTLCIRQRHVFAIRFGKDKTSNVLKISLVCAGGSLVSLLYLKFWKLLLAALIPFFCAENKDLMEL